MSSGYGISTVVEGEFADVVERTRIALATQGFGVLTEIDVAATMKAKLGADMPPHLILGACNAPLAHRALTIEPSLGLLLPCNVVVRAVEGNRVVVEVTDPLLLVSVTGRGELTAIADEARDGLVAALAALAQPRSSA
jgi:uncharacterized protein (DUF302 family)